LPDHPVNKPESCAGAQQRQSQVAKAQNAQTVKCALIQFNMRANVALATGDPWQEALDIASQTKARALVIDTENSTERIRRPRDLARALGAEYVSLDNLELNDDIVLAVATTSVWRPGKLDRRIGGSGSLSSVDPPPRTAV
jgi:Mg-chelatase subunit ChlD